MKEINECEALLDRLWAMLNKKYEEVHGKRNYGYSKPEFRFVLSCEELRALRRHVTNLGPDVSPFIGVDNLTLFRHPIIEQRRTPYLEVITK